MGGMIKTLKNTAKGAMKIKKLPQLMQVAPKNEKDYFNFFFWRVSKKLGCIIVAGLALFFVAAVLFLKIGGVPDHLECPVFDHDSFFLKFYSGKVKIRASDGHVAYVGEVKGGGVNGSGVLYDKDGNLVYKGGFEDNVYSGEGILYQTGNVRLYEGELQEGVPSGAGQLFDAQGKKIYEGNFLNGGIVYEELTGIPTAQVAEKYTGKQVVYEYEGGLSVFMEDIDAVYCAAGGGDSLDGEWTVEALYILSDEFRSGREQAGTYKELTDCLGDSIYRGTTKASVQDVTAWLCAGSGGLRGDADAIGESPVTVTESMKDVYEAEETGNELEFGIAVYENEGFRYTFFFEAGEKLSGDAKFLFYMIEAA